MKNRDGKKVLLKIIQAVQENKAYLSEVDGLIGDGDHGMNMNKGFTLFAGRIQDTDITFTDGLNQLGALLFNEIGGSMGPIYGAVFTGMADAGAMFEEIDGEGLAAMLDGGIAELGGIVEAQVGDKTLVDTLVPARDALKSALRQGKGFARALEDMKAGAQAGRDATKGMAAKFGRSSRLGERSRGVLDAGAASCCIILTAMADGLAED
ncbi:MAG: dihydroxyacetone kinase subunit L [Spirochaetaceae bacterium]|jgi:dihydroxyacetone kinase-like protein|nr:dihydroxyacetone kinase subunit L [Spirochaetaceae bacterium]